MGSRARRQLIEEELVGTHVASVKNAVDRLETVAEAIEATIASIDQTSPSTDTVDLEEAAENVDRALKGLLGFIGSWEARQHRELSAAAAPQR